MSLGPETATPTPPPGPAETSWRVPFATLLVVVLLGVGGLVANVVSQQAHSSETTGTNTVRVDNAILFLVDDMSDFSCAETRLYLPRSSRWLLDRGTCYENATTSTPVCCPARAQIQTGQYSHNNRVVSQTAARNIEVRDTVQHDLGLIGVDTYGIGKNLNGVEASEYYGPDAVDTGFTDFDFWNSYKSRPGRFKLYDDTGAKYAPLGGLSNTRTNGAFLHGYLDEKLATGEPFFVYDAFVAPHKQGIGFAARDLPEPSPEHADDPVPPFRYAPEGYARDKLPIFWGPKHTRAYYERLFAARVRSLYDVDDEMALAFEKLEAAGALDETAVIFTSDNGYTDHGENNWEGKSIPYPAAMNIPMLAYYPSQGPTTEGKAVALVDVAPTLYDVFGVVPGHVVDGHSMLGNHVREVTYGEFYNEDSGLSRRESGVLASNLRSWRMVRQGRQSYVEWYAPGGQTVFREFYADPAMTKNLLWHTRDPRSPTAATLREFERLLRRHGICQGTEAQGSPRPCP